MKKIALVIALLGCSYANAASLSFSGNFATDNSRFYTTFDVTAATTVTLRSLGYAGGVNLAGSTIADGGFDTQLFLFNSSGSLLQSDDDSSNVTSVSSSNSWDALVTRALGVGSYTVVLTQYNSDYVSGDLFSGVWSPANTSNFVDASNNQRTSAYAFDISGDNITDITGRTTDIPEPASLALFGLGLVGLVATRRKLNRSA